MSDDQINSFYARINECSDALKQSKLPDELHGLITLENLSAIYDQLISKRTIKIRLKRYISEGKMTLPLETNFTGLSQELTLALDPETLEIQLLLADSNTRIDLPLLFNVKPSLMIAIKNKNTKLVKRLLRNEADTDPNQDNHAPLKLAIDSGNLEMLQVLLNHKNTNTIWLKQDQELLKVSAQNGHVDICLKLIELGCQVNSTNIDALIKLNNPKVNSTIAPFLYEQYSKKIAQMIFVKQDKEKKQENYTDIPVMASAIIYNNNQYSSYQPNDAPYTQGNELYLDELKNTPIGYNIHLPEGKIEGMIVEVYGGFSKNEKEQAFQPGAIDASKKYLLNSGIAVVTLNLPDLLKLEASQGDMPASLHLEIQSCINRFYESIKNNPESLHEKLKDLDMENIKIALYGASFGASMVMHHAQSYNKFDYYISHNGWVDSEMGYKSDLPLVGRKKYQAHLDSGRLDNIEKINKPVLLLATRNDHNVNMKVATEFCKNMVRLGKSDLVRILVTDTGNPAPTETSEIHNKGHFIPTNNNDFIIYCETILNLMKNGPSAVPEFTEFEGYRQDKLADKFFKSANLEQKFVAEALELFEKMLITYEVLDYKMLKEDIIQKQINFLWEEKYKPLYCAMWQATKLTKFMWKKSTQSALKNEITRITPFLTNEVIMNTLKAQDEFFLPFIAELYSPTLAKDIELSGIYSHPGIIAKFKAILQDLPNQKDEAFVHYFLSSLYKANPHLLPDFEKMNTVPADLNLKSAKEAFSNTLLEGQKLLITAYEAQHLNTLKKVMLDNLNDAQPNNPQPQNLSSPGVFFSFPSNQKDIKTKYEKAILDTKNIKELTNLWEDIIKKVTINPEKNNLDQLLSIAQSMSSPAQINQKITKKQ